MPDWLMRQIEKLSDYIGAFEVPSGTLKRNAVIGGVVVVIFVLGVGVSLGLSGSGTSANRATKQVDADAPIYLRIEPGMTASSIGLMLSDHDVIDSRFCFWLLSKLNGADDKFKTGMYRFERNMNTRDVLNIIINGETSPIRFTIPEGFNVNEIAARLDEQGITSADDFKKSAKKFAPYRYMVDEPNANYRAEGFLFPDTYEIDDNLPAISILQMMARNFDNRLTEEMRERAASEGLSVYELVTLASLVEKEARFDEDRPIIAQVFLKRLKMDMPLQSDTTIQYLLDAPKEDVSYEDTEIESPYNTYQHIGLPPGPIANPGMDAIEAVLYPANTDYLYFVADRQGHNHYSRTYDEHLEIVDRVR